MSVDNTDCNFCGKEAYVKDRGVIFVRAEVEGKWTNVPSCIKCWKERYRPQFKEEKASNMLGDKKEQFWKEETERILEKLKKDPKMAEVLKELPTGMKGLQEIANTLWKITEGISHKLPDDFICKKYLELNKLATKDLDSEESRKYRRACMQHPWFCEHPHCLKLREFLKFTGMDKMSHPDYGIMNKEISKEEEKEMEKGK